VKSAAQTAGADEGRLPFLALTGDDYQWDANLETSAAAIAGKTSDASAMPLGDLPDKGEAEACAAGRGAALVEWLEDLV